MSYNFLPTHHGVRHVALAAQDLARATAFYREALDFEPYYLGDTDWAMLHAFGTTLSLIHTPHHHVVLEKGVHPPHIGFTVSNRGMVDAWYERLQKAGYSPLAPKKHRDESYGFYFQDTEGNPLELIFIPYRAQRLGLNHTAFLLLAPGTSRSLWEPLMAVYLKTLSEHVPWMPGAWAFSEGVQPDMHEAIKTLSKTHAIRYLTVLPLFLPTTSSLMIDMPSLLEDFKKRYPTIHITLEKPLGLHPVVQEAMVQASVDVLLRAQDTVS